MGLGERISKAAGRLPRTAWQAVAFGLAFLAFGQVGVSFIFPPQENAVLWPASGLTLAVLLRSSPRRWPAFLLALAVAETWQVMANGDPLPVALAWAAGNVLRSLLGAGLMWRMLGPGVQMSRVRDVGGLLLYGAVLACAVSATLGVGAVALFKGGPHPSTPAFWVDWVMWWLSDGLGTLLVAPLLLSWWPGSARPLRRAQWVEMALVLGLLALVADVIFASRLPRAVVPALPYVAFPFVVWAALRLGPRGASAATSVLVVIAAWQTREGHGPYGILPATPGERVLSVQAFVAVASLMSVTLAALAAERRRAERSQRALVEAGAVLAESLDYRATLPRVAALVVPEFASGVGVWVQGREGQLERVAAVRLSAAEQEALRQHAQPLPQAARTWVGGGVAHLLVPLRGQEGVVGVLGKVDVGRARPFTPREVGLAEDLARRCALAVESARHLAEAHEAVAVRDEFIAIAAHELRTPLTALKLRLQSLAHLLHRGLDGPEEALAKLHTAARQTSRLSKLVESLLDVGRINTGQLQLQREQVDLAALVEDVAERFSEEAERAGCPLTLTLEPGVTAWVDRERVEQALLNLLANAAKFGRGQPIELEVSRRGEVSCLVVRDRGIGIAPEALDRIFGRFERAVSAREYGGLGLGLFLTRQIAEAHGGRVAAESRPGEGATFVLELPSAPAAVTHGEASPPPPA